MNFRHFYRYEKEIQHGNKRKWSFGCSIIYGECI